MNPVATLRERFAFAHPITTVRKKVFRRSDFKRTLFGLVSARNQLSLGFGNCMAGLLHEAQCFSYLYSLLQLNFQRLLQHQEFFFRFLRYVAHVSSRFSIWTPFVLADFAFASSGFLKVSVCARIARLAMENAKYFPGFSAAICSIRSRAFESPWIASIHTVSLPGRPEKISKDGSFIRHL